MTSKPEDVLTTTEAFIALRIFLQHHWALRGGQPSELSDLIAFLSPMRDGGPADPAMWPDWLDAVAEAKALSGRL